MKRFVLLFLTILLSLSVSFAFAEMPAPFEKAKGIALSGVPVEDYPNCFSWKKEVAINSTGLNYVIGFCKSDNSIALIKINDSDTYFIIFTGNSYVAMHGSYGLIVDYQEISQEDAVKAGFGFFRELIEHKLLE